MNARTAHTHSPAARHRRGNTIVLVTGILVLLVIIATAFVVRTQAGRTTATSISASGTRDDNARNIADDLAREIALSLFARWVDTTGLASPLAADANTLRFPPPASADRFFPDETDVFAPLGRADFPWNTPPYAVVPWTNWPDFLPGGLGGPNINWPAGVGNQHGSPSSVFLESESNPLGFPGYGDTRWLRDILPILWDSDSDGIPDALSYWKHMTNIARPDNGWRIAYNVADIEASLVTDLNIPVEQWLNFPNHAGTVFASRFNATTGDAIYPGQAIFQNQWLDWFGSLGSYQGIYSDPANVPLNCYRLNNLGPPQDEFIFGTDRWSVSRVLADTDGDGYTDSFWFLAPTPLHSGIRQIVAVSIIDNSAMLNANVATRYIRSDVSTIWRKTLGLTPTDLALVGQGRSAGSGNFNTGLYDLPENWMPNWLLPGGTMSAEIDARYDILEPSGINTLWGRHLAGVGLTTPAGVPLDFPDTFTRLDYWRRSASQGIDADNSLAASDALDPLPVRCYTPFGLDDELELRMFAGQNYPWILSRFELTTESNPNFGTSYGLLRAKLNREESAEFIDQLPNRLRANDLRSNLTMYNGARNDTMPPWLWVYGPNKDHNGVGGVTTADRDLNGDGNVDVLDQELFMAGTRKFDLRLPYDFGVGGPRFFVHGDFDDPVTSPTPKNYEFTENLTALQFGIALRDRIRTALIDDIDNLPGNRGTYYGVALNDVDQTNELAAAFAANIAQWRDYIAPNVIGDLRSHELSPLSEAVPVPAGPTNPTPSTRFMGMEPQPFLVEAFVGHIYADPFGAIPATDAAGNPYLNAGQHVVVEGDTHRGSAVIVQIANPYERPISVGDTVPLYQVRVFGQEFDIPVSIGSIPAAADDMPSTVILFTIKKDLNGDTTFDDKWRDFLDILPINHTPGTILIEVPETIWEVADRSTYDSSGESAVEIRRYDEATATWVTIDRFDNPADRRFGDEVNGMETTRPPDPAPEPPATWIHGVPGGADYPGLNIGVDGSGFDHWVQWVRATRAWAVDVNNDGANNPNERNPRYVFGDSAVVTAGGAPADITDAANTATRLNGGNRYRYADPPDSPWFTRPYTREDPANAGTDLVIDTRKPTFFDFDHVTPLAAPAVGGDPAFPNWSFPNKGWYGQKGTGSVDDPIIDATNNVRTYRHPYAMQMLHKDADFEQVGEVLNVFLYGHKLQFSDNTALGVFTGETLVTFSEYMSEPAAGFTGYNDIDQRYRTNRLLLVPVNTGSGIAGAMVGVGDPAVFDDPRHAIPNLPAGVRLLEGLVCDGWGIDPIIDLNGDGSIDVHDAELRSFRNAKGFDGSITPGLVNVNTSTMQVRRTMPHAFRLVHEFGSPPGLPAQPFFNNAGQPLVTTAQNAAAALPRVMLPEAIEHYRERHNGFGPNLTGIPGGPDYSGRPNPRGMSTIGELLLLNLDAQFPVGHVDRLTSNTTDRIYNEQWRIDLAVAGLPVAVGAALPARPFWDGAGGGADQISMLVSTDRQGAWDPFATVAGTPRADVVAGDVEEANMLFAGISNLVTTRSDVFTVYFRVRSFRQNTSVSPPVWDATNREYIIDDSRYVMLVDRSGVNKPGDKPRILYLEKLPN